MLDERDYLDKIDKIQLYATWFLRITLIIAIIISIINKRPSIIFITSLILLLTFLPDFIEKKSIIHFPIEFEFVIILFIYASIFLGEVNKFYDIFWWWDIALHTISGLAIGFAGFMILFTLYNKRKIESSAFIIAFFSFMFAIGIGTIWEIFEFSMDQIFKLNMQKSGLVDTMSDLIVDSIGALVTSFIGYQYIKGDKNPIFKRLIKKFIIINPKLYNKHKKNIKHKK